MAGDKMPARKRLTATVLGSVVRALDRQVRALRKGRSEDWSRSDLVRLAVSRLIGPELPKREREAVYRELLRRAGPMKLRAQAHLAEGRPHLARPLYLRAAALEMEALALLEDPSEATLKSSLLEILVLLKHGTGYRHLPDVPGDRRAVKSLQ